MHHVSIIIRTYNEERYLNKVLTEIKRQKTGQNLEREIIIVDSGSTDETLKIAHRHNCRIVHIKKEEFSFGRSLNMGCETAKGNILVFLSGHCIPASHSWLENLISPLSNKNIALAYGKQTGLGTTKFSERQIYKKYFPETSLVPQEGFFCNNANAALKKSAWKKFKFNEELTGLEDMHLAKKLIETGLNIAYIAEAPIYHIHHESWQEIRRRYEREAIALQHIMPEVYVKFSDFLRFLFSALSFDTATALEEKKFLKEIKGICLYRLMQYWGSYRGNHETRQLSNRKKEIYFFPKEFIEKDIK